MLNWKVTGVAGLELPTAVCGNPGGAFCDTISAALATGILLLPPPFVIAWTELAAVRERGAAFAASGDPTASNTAKTIS